MKFEVTTIIDAPPHKVQEVLLDLAKYPDWNPMIKAVTGTSKAWTATVNENLTIWVITIAGVRVPLVVKCLAATEPTPGQKRYELSWSGNAVFDAVLKGTHSFVSEAYNDPETKTLKTKFIHTEVFEGLAQLPTTLVAPYVPESMTAQSRYVDFNDALKKRVETYRE
ncbi:hypothetical protein HK101_006016 [Irineochytrium annulatum]|nr:hypothetical protein HK101_006016 [Irineochytrium annulatum]